MKRLGMLIIVCALILSGCHVVSQEAEFASKEYGPKVIAGPVTAHGMLVTADQKPITGTPVHFAQVFRSEDSAAFLYDAGNSPSVLSSEDGTFSMANLEAGEYVIVVGDPMTDYQIITEDGTNPKVFVMQGGESVEIGPLTITYQ